VPAGIQNKYKNIVATHILSTWVKVWRSSDEKTSLLKYICGVQTYPKLNQGPEGQGYLKLHQAHVVEYTKMAADCGDSGHVIDTDTHNDILREFFDFGDDLVLPDKPFEVKKEGNDYDGSGIDFDVNHFGSVDDPSDDFFMGATPSPSSSSTTSSSATSSAMTSSAPPTRYNNCLRNLWFYSPCKLQIG